jgi:alanyl-tRNA synthetase
MLTSAETETNSGITPTLTASEIRTKFLEFFRSKQHHVVPSAPIVLKNDPTLMFTNAGMNQFKDYFLGNKSAPYQRVADTQKCLRVSGKHNDLEEVGVDHYHHTMFEMLGNWSFGDYFKAEAIDWSWELLTDVYEIPKDRLYVTVFEGDANEQLPPSSIALAKWNTLTTPEHIVYGNKKDNFWEMGDTGPCGPCSEIHVDLRSDEERKQTPGRDLVNKDHPQVIEIWNNVFIQYNRKKDGTLENLPQRHVDTGMGFERLVRVLQNKKSNYDTDVFSGLIQTIAKVTGQQYTATDEKKDIAFRVNADHIRAIAFTIADGQLPSNTGAGYVIRRILRRAVRYYYSYLNYQQPLLFQLVPVLAEQFHSVFPELHQQEQFVSKVIREEEEAFLRTLEKGLKRIEDIIGNTNGNISGKDAFELYDTYGFPFDLTRLIASERGLNIDEEAFTKEMQQQKDRSRAATATDTEDWIVVNNGFNNSVFIGYDSLETEANVLRYRKVKAKGKEAYQLILDRTPFYAESGGQIGDTGELIIGNERVRITDTKKENDLIIHFAEKLPDNLAGEIVAKIDFEKRKKTALHHSATHLLHAALRQVLGKHVAQRGSLVHADNLRFDFSHFSKMTEEEISAVESIVNEKIRQNIPVVIREMDKDEAVQMGAMALFGEKYGDKVRVVTIDPSYSIELCGGTHVSSTGELGFFKIISESAVAAGVRRIEAICGTAAEQYINDQIWQLRTAKESLKNPKDLTKAIQALYEENSLIKKQLERYEQASLLSLRNELEQKKQFINGIQFVGEMVPITNAEALKKLAYELKPRLQDFIIVLAANIEGKAALVLLFDEMVAANKDLDASKIIKQQISPLIKGGGGGQKTLATAGGQDATALHQAIEAVKALL